MREFTSDEFTGEDLCLPAPPPEMVHAARDYLTPQYASGIDAVLWEIIAHPLPDLDAIDAVNTATARAQAGTGEHPEPMAVAAALVVLRAVRLELDQTEARLLNTAQSSGLDWQQIAAILDLSAEQAEERHRRLKPRLDEPAADINPPRFGPPRHRPRIAIHKRDSSQRPPRCPPATTSQPATWDEPEDEAWQPW
ncbi:hypothetical protein ACGFNU_47010 [Spirillospora sp. NPDC048911]|uniref:hypothetical protein n=1 Tax=Spirillospora sp. NPDC048911 TaxID=3364527 RepID=UPI003724A9A7